MTAIIAAWPIIKRFLPFIGGALVIIGALLWLRHDRAAHIEQGKRSRDAEVAKLTDAIAVQNAAIEQLHTATVTAQTKVLDATLQAAQSRKATAGLQARLKVAGRAKGDCGVAAINKEAWSVAQ